MSHGGGLRVRKKCHVLFEWPLIYFYLNFSSGWHHSRVFQQPADQVLRSPDPWERDQDPMEDLAAKPVRGNQEVHRWADHQD